ncbi:murein hydrolase activator EnvC family protein [Halothiobacillus sp. DCM-1]|uniref:murein hydrolase activator EnvC family protein n=1 Tax=Halothiobacillus sp. DCM-1 TaxID=3112558 RepID=UPI00324A8174
MLHDHAFFRFLRPLAVAWLWLAVPVLAFAAPDSRTINQAIEQQRQALEHTRKAQQSLRQQLTRTQQAMASSEAKRDDLADERDRIAAQQAELQARAEALDEQMRAQKQRIDTGLRLAYSLSNQHPLGALLDPRHALDDARFLHYLQQILTQTNQQIAELHHDQQAATANQQALTRAAQKLDQAQQQLDAEHQRYQAAQAEQNRLLSQLVAQADAQSQALAELLAKKKTLDEEIVRLNAATQSAKTAREPHAPAQSGAQPRSALSEEELEAQAPRPAATPAAVNGGIPVSGKILRAYGAEIADGDMRAQGISFAAPAGSPVRAVAAGRVIFADSMKGWGELVILKHPGGYLSLYANNSALSVRTGQQVSAGAVIARCGQLNGRESGLYFEVRRGNDPVNPSRWAAYRQARR